MIFARKLPEFYIKITRKIFSRILGGGGRAVSYAYIISYSLPQTAKTEKNNENEAENYKKKPRMVRALTPSAHNAARLPHSRLPPTCHTILQHVAPYEQTNTLTNTTDRNTSWRG